jgi:cell division protein FtsB
MNFSQIISILALAGGIVGVYVKLQSDIAVIKNILQNQQKEIDEHKQENKNSETEIKRTITDGFNRIDSKLDKINEHFLNCQK